MHEVTDILRTLIKKSLKTNVETIISNYDKREWEPIDDSPQILPEDDTPEENRILKKEDILGKKYPFGSYSWEGFEDSSIVAVDTGLVSLGEIREGGFAFAIRGAIIFRKTQVINQKFLK